MTFEITVVTLIVLPLAAGAVSFALRRMAGMVLIAVTLLETGLALRLALLVLREGPLRYKIGGWGAPLGIDLYADGLSVLMLLMTAGVSLGVTVYASAYFKGHGHAGPSPQRLEQFRPLGLFLWATLNALFLSGDIFNLYVTLELLTLGAVAMIGLSDAVEALTAALRYLLFAVVASLFYLLGVALLYHSYGTVDWQLLAPRFQFDWPSKCAMVCITVGLLLKTALFPLHFWLPAAHANAPAPVSALLSAVVLKASFFVFFRLWFEVFPYLDMPKLAHLLSGCGAAAILWGSVQAIRQQRLKLMVAYSTVAQMGYLFLVFSMVTEPTVSRLAWSGAAYFMVSHAFAKAAAFLAAGSLHQALGTDNIHELAGSARRHPVTVFAFALAGVALMGLPPSGAFIAKWQLLSAAIQSDRWDLVAVLLTGSLLAAIYVMRVVSKAFAADTREATHALPAGMQWTPLALALASIGLGILAFWPMRLLDVGAPFSAARTGVLP